VKTINQLRIEYRELSRERAALEDRLFIVNARINGIQAAIKNAEK
jgi:hypothetical protein